jgi:hypothetical protein
MAQEYSIGGMITFPQLTASYGLISGVIGAASLVRTLLVALRGALCACLWGFPYGARSASADVLLQINPHLCYDLVGQPSRWVPMLESSSGLYTLRLFGYEKESTLNVCERSGH